ncbi:MAG: acetyl-CoA carboxylase biotin carboxyl carrier protein subunit [Acidibrevibacterium sp.]|jgi:biotin carboxyl carrier protein|uniref:acetyl-CoA carboxylase biotin carboxyl carrier protein subunit n=1 Tax=Acidibrevibacterium fodinaquatile TaxID=1969806 RepID=UPI0023A79C1C|nr:acetyl-CoA carboxylase biotin carboxyl carrier protein subunit [Acidibrevibacterium fodinaquatile]MCA7120868.1 acetyl-CoA carboxylase biotin carboxyl carrier protein subunit [Acidibrevibacterium fodinaquatile]
MPTNLPPGQLKIVSDLNASVWRVLVAEGQAVAAGETLLLLESMKMEIPVTAPEAGTIVAILAAEETVVNEGDPLIVMLKSVG